MSVPALVSRQLSLGQLRQGAQTQKKLSLVNRMLGEAGVEVYGLDCWSFLLALLAADPLSSNCMSFLLMRIPLAILIATPAAGLPAARSI